MAESLLHYRAHIQKDIYCLNYFVVTFQLQNSHSCLWLEPVHPTGLLIHSCLEREAALTYLNVLDTQEVGVGLQMPKCECKMNNQQHKS